MPHSSDLAGVGLAGRVPVGGVRRQWRRTSVTGSEESAGRPRDDGGRPVATIEAPRAATMAPLSVHSLGRGTRSRTPAFSQRSAAIARSRELAATPPPITRSWTPYCRQAATALRVSTSTTASWNEAATSATGTASPASRRASTQRATAVFRPANEKSSVPSWYLARGNLIASGSPEAAALSIGGPPGNGMPSTLATLSYASPAASSIVAPSGCTSPVTSGTKSSDEWPPDTSRDTHGDGSGPCSSWSTATCAARWFTPYKGLPSA